MAGILSAPRAAGGTPGGEVIAGLGDANLAASFKEFCSRPENARLVAKQQKKEIQTVVRLEQQARAEHFQEVVLSSDEEAQRNIAPFLAVPVLRRIVQTLSNDERGDFAVWACNPRVLGMLRECKRLMDEGRVSEGEIERTMLAQITQAGNPAGQEMKAKMALKARLTTEQLIPALNEHLEERYAGNSRFEAKDWAGAMARYERALAVLKVVEGVSRADQQEVDRNRTTVLLNIAAVHFERKDFGAAAERCSEALEYDPDNLRGLLRRARAYGRRREFALAEADLARVKDLEPWNEEAETETEWLRRARARDAAEERKVWGSKLSAGARGASSQQSA